MPLGEEKESKKIREKKEEAMLRSSKYEIFNTNEKIMVKDD
jgi:hypothetical protein